MNVSVRKSDTDLISADLHYLLESISTKRKSDKILIFFKKVWMQKNYISFSQGSSKLAN